MSTIEWSDAWFFQCMTQGTALLLLVWLLGGAFRGRVAHRWIFWLWLLPLVRLLLPVTPASDLHPSKLIDRLATSHSTFVDTSFPAGESTSRLQSAGIESAPPAAELSGQDGTLRSTVSETRSQDSPTPPSSEGTLDFRHLMFSVWTLGALTAAARLFVSRWRLRRLIHEATAVANGPLVTRFQFILSDLKCRRRIGLATHPGIMSPCLAGTGFGAIILIPEDLAGTHSLESCDDLLRHELQHAKRHDDWILALFQAVSCLHWFNPLLHLARRRFLADCELACDEATLADASPHDRRRYGETLLTLASMPTHPSHAVATTLSAVQGRSKIARRIEQITHPVKSTRTAATALGLIALLVAFAGLTRARAGAPSEMLSLARTALLEEHVPTAPTLGMAVFLVDSPEQVPIESLEDDLSERQAVESLIARAKRGDITLTSPIFTSEPTSEVISGEHRWTLENLETSETYPRVRIRCFDPEGRKVFALVLGLATNGQPRLIAEGTFDQQKHALIYLRNLNP